MRLQIDITRRQSKKRTYLRRRSREGRCAFAV